MTDLSTPSLRTARSHRALGGMAGALLLLAAHAAGAARLAILNTRKEVRLDPLVEYVEAELSRRADLEILERRAVEQLLAEHEHLLARAETEPGERRHLGQLLRADVLAFLNVRENELCLRISDVQSGLVIGDHAMSALTDTLETTAGHLVRAIETALRKLEEERVRIVAVPPFVCDDVADTYAHQSGSYQALVEQWAREQPGLFVVDLAEARAFLNEMEIRQEAHGIFRHPRPLFISGTYRNEGVGDRRRVRVRLLFEEGPDTRIATEIEEPPERLAGALRSSILAHLLADSAPMAGPDDPTLLQEADALWRHAHELIGMGHYRDALALLEAVLLLLPEGSTCDFNGWHYVIHPKINLGPVDRCALVYSRILQILPSLSHEEYARWRPYYLEKWAYTEVSAEPGSASYFYWGSLKSMDQADPALKLKYTDDLIEALLRIYEWMARNGPAARGHERSFRAYLPHYIIPIIYGRTTLALDPSRLIACLNRYMKVLDGPEAPLECMGLLVGNKVLPGEAVARWCEEPARWHPAQASWFRAYAQLVKAGPPEEWKTLEEVPLDLLAAFERQTREVYERVYGAPLSAGHLEAPIFHVIARAHKRVEALRAPPSEEPPPSAEDRAAREQLAAKWRAFESREKNRRVAIPLGPAPDPASHTVRFTGRTRRRPIPGPASDSSGLPLREIQLQPPFRRPGEGVVPRVSWKATGGGFDSHAHARRLHL